MSVVVQRLTWFGNRKAHEEIYCPDEKVEELVRITRTNKDLTRRFVDDVETCSNPYLVRVFVYLVQDFSIKKFKEIGLFFPSQPKTNWIKGQEMQNMGSPLREVYEIYKKA